MSQCPEKCLCTAADTVADCTNVSFQDIPMGLHEHIQHLTLSHNNITVLRKNHFVSAGLIHLDVLTIEFNGIIIVEPGAFNGLSGLTNLHLQNNNITTLQPGTFSNVTNLSGLHLAANKIQILPSGVFLGLENLSYLSLERNEIEELHEDIFIGLTNLRNLWLSGNRISHLHPDVFKHMSKLQLISFSNNKNLIVPTDRPFLNVPSLRRYILSACNITTLSAKSFQMSPNLESLVLQDNMLKTIDVVILESLPLLKYLPLFGNPMHCDCSLQRVWQWCLKYNIATEYKDQVLKCQSPHQVSGLWWGVLEQANCSDGNVEFQGDYRSATYKHVPHEFEEYWDFVTYIESSVYGIMFMVGAFGNITVMVIIGCNKRMRNVPSAFIFNLAVGDLLSLIMNLPLSHVVKLSHHSLLGGSMCHFGFFFLEMSIGVSGFSVAVLSIQRNYATSGSLRLSTRRATIMTIIAVWTVASICALPAAFSMHVDMNMICSPHYRMEYYKMTLLFHLLVFCVLPLSVIVLMYVTTARNLVRRAHCSADEVQRCKTLAKIVIGLAAVFFVSFVPYHVLITILAWEDPMFELSIGYMMFASKCLLALNPCLNPVSLCCTSATFRKMFKHYLSCCCRSRFLQKNDNSDLPEYKEASVHYRKDFSTETVNL
jgi:Leucine-rich repeat (LRR) protein